MECYSSMLIMKTKTKTKIDLYFSMEGLGATMSSCWVSVRVKNVPTN